jgi:hypothetical protein
MNDAQRARIDTATREMAHAETELTRALGEMRSGTRAEKTTVTAVVETALERLKAARVTVAELETLLGSDVDRQDAQGTSAPTALEPNPGTK